MRGGLIYALQKIATLPVEYSSPMWRTTFVEHGLQGIPLLQGLCSENISFNLFYISFKIDGPCVFFVCKQFATGSLAVAYSCCPTFLRTVSTKIVCCDVVCKLCSSFLSLNTTFQNKYTRFLKRCNHQPLLNIQSWHTG